MVLLEDPGGGGTAPQLDDFDLGIPVVGEYQFERNLWTFSMKEKLSSRKQQGHTPVTM